jgi:glutamine phosphoribosylpyrophosphate amidotransferase
MLRMLELLKHRGEDATGIAAYASVPGEGWRLRFSCREPGAQLPRVREIVAARGRWVSEEITVTHSPYYLVEAVVDLPGDAVGPLYRCLEADPDLCVHSFSDSLAVFKDVGPARNLTGYKGLEELVCSHVVGHVRLATESVDNLNFAHPFASPLRPDLAIVHNGQLTNYFRLRRSLESKGVAFKTGNDSELIAHYLAYKTAVAGRGLQEALKTSIDELDGVFSYVAATATEIGAVQDRLGLKPIVIYETVDRVLLGSEQLCFSVLDEETAGEEITPGEVRYWSNSIAPA